jgi:hypothetical protein
MSFGTRTKRIGRRARLRRAPMRYKPPKPGSKRAVRDELDSVDAQIVKPRDGYWCVQCRTDGVPNQGILDAGHLYPKGKFPGGRFLLENLFAQCRFHNQLHIGSPMVFMTWYQETYSPEQLQALHKEVLKPAPSLETMVQLLAEREEMLSSMRLLASASI